MSRTTTSLLVALVLGLGVAIGAVAGAFIATAAPTPGIALVSPGPSARPSPSATEPAPSGSGPGESPSVPPSETPSPSPSATPRPTPRPVLAPLTGLRTTKARATRHVIAVMIDDQFAARPQSGLSKADIVWQAPAEGGIPRYMALFQSQDAPAIGPVRSSRLYFIAWASQWKAVYVHAGGSPQALALLGSSKGRGSVVFNADEFRWGGRYLWRIHTRLAPHNVYTDSKHLRALATRLGAKSVTYKPAWTFAPDAMLALRPKGGTIIVPYQQNQIRYSYDRETNRYLRTVSIEGKQVDAGTKSRVAPKNVVVLMVNFVPLHDHKNRLDGQVTGTGVAWIAHNGHTVKGTWRKKSFTAPMRLFGPNGKAITLTAGQTFVQAVDIGTKITIKDGKVPPRPAANGEIDLRGKVPS